MFVIAAVPVGLLLGGLLGGSLDGLAALRFRWAWLAIAGLLVQVVLFSGALDGPLAESGVGPAVYVGSTAAVLAAVVRNLAVPWLGVVAAGAGANLAAIVANGGYMPADPGAAATAGLSLEAGGFSNSVVTATPALRPLTDIFAIPAGVPLANVFSLGDVLIAAGTAVVIASAMRRGRGTDVPPAGRPDEPVRAGNSPD